MELGVDNPGKAGGTPTPSASSAPPALACWANPPWQGKSASDFSHACQIYAHLSMCFCPGPSAPQTLPGKGLWVLPRSFL